MPFVHVYSNIARGSVHRESVLKALSKTLSATLDSPQAHVMAQISLCQDMIFAETTEPCALIEICTIGNICPERNPKTMSVLTETVAKELNVPKSRVFMFLTDMPGNNWGFDGKPVVA